MVRYLVSERVSTCRKFRIFIVNKSVTADSSLLSPTEGVNGIHPAPDIHEHFMIHKGYGTLRKIFTHNFNNPERTVTICMNITMHTDVNTAVVLSTLRTVFRCIALVRTSSHVAQVSSVCLHFHPWSSACALVLECSVLPSVSPPCSQVLLPPLPESCHGA